MSGNPTTVAVGIRGVDSTPDFPRMEPIPCPACKKPFAEGRFAPGTLLMVKCHNRRCVAHAKERMITVHTPTD